MNLRAGEPVARGQAGTAQRFLGAMFLLDFAPRTLEDFVRAFSTEERLFSPGYWAASRPGNRLAIVCPGEVKSPRAGWCGIKKRKLQEER